jgi:adenylate cyclase
VESWYQRARALARANGARSYELRIGLGLAELWLAHGRQREARALLAEVDDWFSEGRDTPDRRAAAALRQELRGT